MGEAARGRFQGVFGDGPVLIGMVHLPPLPGYPAHPGMPTVVAKALANLAALEEAGFDAVLVENDGDQPHRVTLAREVRDGFAEVMASVVSAARVPVGMEALYDMPATVALAHAAGARFVRLDVFADDVETRWGRVPASAPAVAALVAELGAQGLLLLADVHVKHARALTDRGLADSARASLTLGADGLIVTGARTGLPPAEEDCRTVRAAAGAALLLVGSGLDVTNAARLLNHADGAIVGTSITTEGAIDPAKAVALVRATRG